MNKKAEGNASGFLVALVLFLVAIVGISTLVSNATNDYSVNNVDDFEGYEGIYKNTTDIAQGFTGSLEDITGSSSGKETAEDLTFSRALKGVNSFRDSGKTAANAVVKTLNKLGIPVLFITAIILILMIVLIAKLIAIIRGFNNV